MKASSGSAECKQAAVKSAGTNNFMQTKRRIARDSLNYRKLQREQHDLAELLCPHG
jgi:hypothetical protein